MSKQFAAIAIAVQAGEPILLWGDPGIGKSSNIYALGQALELTTEVVIASLREPADFNGLPVVMNPNDSTGTARVSMAPPAWALKLLAAKSGLLVFDELSGAPPAVQQATLRVVLERVVGDLALPKTVSVIAAANPASSTTATWELTAQLANRFCHLDWPLDTDAWCSGMVAGFPRPEVPKLPDNWRDRIPQKKALVAAFIKRRPELLLKVPKSNADAGREWPSPRSWDMAARLWAAADAAGVETEVRNVLVGGCVGPAATEFFTWIDEFNLPDPEELLENPTSLEIGDRGDLVYVALAAVANVVVTKPSPQRWCKAWKVLGHAVRQGAPDVAAFAAEILAQNRPKGLTQLPEELSLFTDVLVQASPKK